MKDTYVTVSELSEMFKISYDNALDWVKHSGVEYIQIGRQYRISLSKLEAFLYPKLPVKQKIGKRPIIQIIERTD